MNNKIIVVRKYKELVQSDNGGELHWIKFYPDRILGSMNFKRCDIREQSLYLAIFIRVRRDGDYCGKLCYPEGVPITFDDLINDMNPKERERIDLWKLALKGIIDKTLIYLEDWSQTARPLVADCPLSGIQTGSPLPRDCKTQPDKPQGVIETNPIDKKKSNINNNINTNIYSHLVDLWNSFDIFPKCRKLTDRITRTVNGRVNDGYVQTDIENAIKNYAKILSDNKTYYFSHKWTIENFIKRANGFPQFIDWEMAHNNCKRKEISNGKINKPSIMQHETDQYAECQARAVVVRDDGQSKK